MCNLLLKARHLIISGSAFSVMQMCPSWHCRPMFGIGCRYNVDNKPSNHLNNYVIYQVAPSVVSSHSPVSFTSEDPALLCRYLMSYGLKPAQLNWQREVTYDDRSNIIDMIKLDLAKFPSRR